MFFEWMLQQEWWRQCPCGQSWIKAAASVQLRELDCPFWFASAQFRDLCQNVSLQACKTD